MQFLQAGQTFPAQLPEMIEKKSPEMKKFFNIIFFKMFLSRGRKQLESPASFFFDNQPNFFRWIFKK